MAFLTDKEEGSKCMSAEREGKRKASRMVPEEETVRYR